MSVEHLFTGVGPDVRANLIARADSIVATSVTGALAAVDGVARCGPMLLEGRASATAQSAGAAQMEERYSSALAHLESLLTTVERLMVTSLDAIVVKHKDQASPMRASLVRFLSAMGLREPETAWLLTDCEKVGFELMGQVFKGQAWMLSALLKGAHMRGPRFVPAHVGFLKFTGEAAVDAQIDKLVESFVVKGMTPSVLHLFPMLLPAVLLIVARSKDARPQAPPSLGAFGAAYADLLA